VAVEDLEGIRNRTRFRKKQRERMSKRAFAELRGYIEYKASLLGVRESLARSNPARLIEGRKVAP
jgi:IS605 OrfB family transposase